MKFREPNTFSLFGVSFFLDGSTLAVVVALLIAVAFLLAGVADLLDWSVFGVNVRRLGQWLIAKPADG